MAEPLLEALNISKTYRRYSNPHLLSNTLTRYFKGRTGYENHRVLQNIDFKIYPGEIVGIVGRNGSGKTTLLRILSSITAPTEGSVKTHAKVVSLLELGAGFDPELTGSENIVLYGSLLGISNRKIKESKEDIVRFSGLDSFIDKPVKMYSSGMIVRLAFSIAIFSNPGVLLLDEIFGVGDLEFQQKCFDYFHTLMNQKCGIILVSHDITSAGTICSKLVCLHDGKIVRTGKGSELIEWYREIHTPIESLAVLDCGKIKVHARNGCFHISWNDQPITVLNGCFVELRSKDMGINSLNGTWTAQQTDNRSMVLTGSWPHGIAKQTWKINVLSDASIQWTIEYSDQISGTFDEVAVNLDASLRYTTVIAPDLIRRIPEIRMNDRIFESILMRTFVRESLCLLPDTSDELPALVLETRTKDFIHSSQVSNGNLFFPARIFQHKAQAANCSSLNFIIRLIGKDEIAGYIATSRIVQSISSNGLTISIDQNELHLMIGSQCLTNRQGFHIADVSDQLKMIGVEWEIVTVEPSMVLRGHCPEKSAVFVWRFHPESRGFNWSIRLELLEKSARVKFNPSVFLRPDPELMSLLSFSPESCISEDNQILLSPEVSGRLFHGPGIFEVTSGRIYRNSDP